MTTSDDWEKNSLGDPNAFQQLGDAMSAVLPPEIELAALWSNEGDDMTFIIEGPTYRNPGSVALVLTSNSTNRHDVARPDGVDDVTLSWSFYGHSLSKVVAAALSFARDLDALSEVTP